MSHTAAGLVVAWIACRWNRGRRDSFGCGDQHRQVLRIAARHHALYGDVLDGGRAHAGGDRRHDLVGRTARVAQHALHGFLRRRRDDEPVAPAPAHVEPVQLVEIARRFDEPRPRGRRPRASRLTVSARASRHSRRAMSSAQLGRDFPQLLARAGAERVRHHRDREIGRAERLLLRAPEADEARRAHRERRACPASPPLPCRGHSTTCRSLSRPIPVMTASTCSTSSFITSSDEHPARRCACGASRRPSAVLLDQDCATGPRPGD